MRFQCVRTKTGKREFADLKCLLQYCNKKRGHIKGNRLLWQELHQVNLYATICNKMYHRYNKKGPSLTCKDQTERSYFFILRHRVVRSILSSCAVLPRCQLCRFSISTMRYFSLYWLRASRSSTGSSDGPLVEIPF